MRLGCIFQHCRIRSWMCCGILVFMVSACGTIKEVRWVTNDSVRIVHETERDTMVMVTADSSWLKAWLECDSTGQVIMKELIAYQEGEHVGIPDVKIDNNVLTTRIKIDSFGIFLKLRDKYEMITTARVETIETVKEVNRLKGWQKVCVGLGIVFLIQFLWGIRKQK